MKRMNNYLEYPGLEEFQQEEDCLALPPHLYINKRYD